MPKVSVIIPVYNVEEYLRECLDSVVNQTLKDIEIICVNDGSTDNSLAILEEYAAKDERLRVFTQENQGASVARNIGIENARSEFICFMDSDDIYAEKTTLEELYACAIKNNVFICGGELVHFDSKTKKLLDENSEWNNQYLFPTEGVIKYSDYQFDYGYTRFIYNLNLIKSNNLTFPNIKRHEDPVFFVKAMSCAIEFYALKKPTYLYRQNFKETTFTPKIMEDSMKGILEIIEISKINKYQKLEKLTAQRFIEIHKWQKKIFLTPQNFLLLLRLCCKSSTILKYVSKCILQNIFSIKNAPDKKNKVITVLGLKIKKHVIEYRDATKK